MIILLIAIGEFQENFKPHCTVTAIQFNYSQNTFVHSQDFNFTPNSHSYHHRKDNYVETFQDNYEDDSKHTILNSNLHPIYQPHVFTQLTSSTEKYFNTSESEYSALVELNRLCSPTEPTNKHSFLRVSLSLDQSDVVGIEMSFRFNFKSESIPTLLMAFSNLEYLQLVGNYFNYSMAAQIERLTHLKLLNFENNTSINSGDLPSHVMNFARNKGDIKIEYVQNPGFDTMDVSAPERAALIEIYNALGGVNWRNNLNWDTSAFVSNWHGITTSNDGSTVTCLVLFSNNLVGIMPTQLGALTNLYNLNLQGNSISGVIPTVLGALTNLSLLSLNSNKLAGTIPTVIAQLTKLTVLEMDTNSLTGDLPSELALLTNLQSLRLNSNRLIGALPSVLGLLTGLTELRLHSNHLTGSIPLEFQVLTKLETLYLSHNSLDGYIPQGIGAWARLITLHLEYNSFQGQIPTELGQLTNLQFVYLNSNNLIGTIPTVLGLLTNLQSLYLSSNSLSGLVPVFASSLSSIDVSHNAGLYLHSPTLIPTPKAKSKIKVKIKVVKLKKRKGPKL